MTAHPPAPHSVYKAHNPDTGSIRACKVLVVSSPQTAREKLDYDNECSVHERLKHPHIIELFFTGVATAEDVPDETWLPGYYLIMEMASGGDLFQKIRTCGMAATGRISYRLPCTTIESGIHIDVARSYFKQLLEGIVSTLHRTELGRNSDSPQAYIHSVGYCHRDMKPENILFDHNDVLKICDFGSAICATEPDSHCPRMLTERTGTLAYMAPEVRRGCSADLRIQAG